MRERVKFEKEVGRKREKVVRQGEKRGRVIDSEIETYDFIN